MAVIEAVQVTSVLLKDPKQNAEIEPELPDTMARTPLPQQNRAPLNTLKLKKTTRNNYEHTRPVRPVKAPGRRMQEYAVATVGEYSHPRLPRAGKLASRGICNTRQPKQTGR